MRVVFYIPGFSAIRYPDVIPSEKDEMFQQKSVKKMKYFMKKREKDEMMQEIGLK